MKKSLLIALFAVLPVMAQECPQKPECADKKPCCRKMCRPNGPRPELTEEQKAEMKAKFEARKAEMKAKFMEKFDADKDGQISDAEKEAIKAQFEAKKAEMKAKFMEKFDADKDGQLSDAEKEAAKAEFQKRGPKGPKCGKKGPRRPGCCGKGPKGQRPQLTEEQKAEMKAKFMEKFDADKDGQLSDAEKEAAKAEFQKRGPKGPKCGKKGHRRPCCAPKCEKN